MGEGRLTRKTEVTRLVTEKGCDVRPDRTLWSWVVPSPLPKRIFEIRRFRYLFEEDAVTVTSPLVPENSCCAYMSATQGFATPVYLPCCFFNIVSVIPSFIDDIVGLSRSEDDCPLPCATGCLDKTLPLMLYANAFGRRKAASTR